MTMSTTTTTQPIASPRRIVTTLVGAAVAVALTVGLVFALTTRGSPVAGVSARLTASGFGGTVNSGPDNPTRHPDGAFGGTVNSGPDNPTRTLSTRCSALANAAPGSQADLHFAQLTARGAC
jgi:hypothetical protein